MPSLSHKRQLGDHPGAGPSGLLRQRLPLRLRREWERRQPKQEYQAHADPGVSHGLGVSMNAAGSLSAGLGFAIGRIVSALA